MSARTVFVSIALAALACAFLVANANAMGASKPQSPSDQAIPSSWANERIVQAPVGLPRSVVRIERDTADALGLLNIPSDNLPPLAFESTATRAEVRAHARDGRGFGQ